MAHVVEHVLVYSAAWKSRVGSEPIPLAPKFETMPTQVCDAKYGAGCCGHTLDKATVTKIDLIHKRSDMWSAITKPRATPLDQPWGQRQPLFYFGDRPGVAAGHADAPRGVVVLMIGARLRQQVLCMEECSPPMPQDIITVNPIPPTCTVGPSTRTSSCASHQLHG